MAQPEESEIRQEVVHVLEQIEHQKKEPVFYQEITESVTRMQPVISEKVTEQLKEQLLQYKELRRHPAVSLASVYSH